MADDAVRIDLVADDRVSRPAKSAADALGKVDKAASQAGDAMKTANRASDDLAKSFDGFAKGAGPALGAALGVAAAGGAAVAATFYGAVQASDKLKAQVDLLGEASNATLKALGDAISSTTAWQNTVEAASASLDTLRTWIGQNQQAIDKLAKEGLNQLFSAAVETVPVVVLLANAIVSLKPVIETVMLGFKYAAPMLALSPAGGAAWIARAASTGELQRDVAGVGQSWSSAGNAMLKIESMGASMQKMIEDIRQAALTGDRVDTMLPPAQAAPRASRSGGGRRSTSVPPGWEWEWTFGSGLDIGQEGPEVSSAQRLEREMASVSNAERSRAAWLEQEAQWAAQRQQQERQRIEQQDQMWASVANAGMSTAASLLATGTAALYAEAGFAAFAATALQTLGGAAKGIGGSLISSGNPYAMAAGVALTIGGQIAESKGQADQAALVNERMARVGSVAAKMPTLDNPMPVRIVADDTKTYTTTINMNVGGSVLGGAQQGAINARTIERARRAGRL